MGKTNSISNVDIVVYALVTLGGAKQTVYSEEIAAKSFELAPSRFSWRLESFRKKGWPDKYIAKTALEDAKKKEHGALVEGSYALELTKDGWRATPHGVRWFKANTKRIEAFLQSQGARTPMPQLQKGRFLKKMNRDPLYKQFLKTGNISYDNLYQFTDMLNCSPDVSKDVIELKFKMLCSEGELVEEDSIIRFLEACRDTFFDSTGTFLFDKKRAANHGGNNEA